MGIGPFHKSSFNDYTPPNPNPNDFQIRTIEQVGNLCIATIYYPGCTTHSGNKILVFQAEKETILKRSSIDPHFLDYDGILIARFPSTKSGYKMAKCFALAWDCHR